MALALDVLQKKGTYPKVIKITPEVWENTTPTGMDNLKKNYDPKLEPYYSMDYSVPPYNDLYQGAAAGLQGSMTLQFVFSRETGEGR